MSYRFITTEGASNPALRELDLAKVAKLRYSVYVLEQGKSYPEADHQLMTLQDELDKTADVIFAVDDFGETVGTVRCNCLDCELTTSQYWDEFEAQRFSSLKPAEMVVCSRLAVHPAHRNAAVRDGLFLEIYRHRLHLGTKVCFATCAPQLLNLFKSYGFRETLPIIHDPIVGTLHRTELFLTDIEHLRSVRSPFLKIAPERAP